MATKKKDDKPESLIDNLEKALAKEMKKLENDTESSLTDKMKVYDRVLKLCAIKLKMDEEGESSGFDDD